jgi:hypothetical protein
MPYEISLRQGCGLGTDLLINRLAPLPHCGRSGGAGGVMAYAIDDAAMAFYERYVFVRWPPADELMLMPIETRPNNGDGTET